MQPAAGWHMVKRRSCPLRKPLALVLLIGLAGSFTLLAAQEAEKNPFSFTPEAIFAGAALPSPEPPPGVLWDPEAILPARPVVPESSPGYARFSSDDALALFPQGVGAAGITPLTPEGKFKLGFRRTFYPVPLLAAAAGAGFSMLVDSDLDEGYEQGFDGFLRRWGARVAFNGTRHFFGTFALPSLLGHDPRYHPSNQHDFWDRVGYAASRTVVTRTDQGGTAFNSSTVLGLAIAAGASAAWVRDQDSSGAEALARFGSAFAFDVLRNIFKEFFTQGD